MPQKELLPEIPFEIRATRIGTCYNVLSRSLLPTKIVIDPAKLDAKAILMVNGSGKLNLRANTSRAKDANETFFAASAKGKIGSWLSVGFNMDASSSEANTSKSLNCYCSYVFSGQRLILMDQGPLALFNYMSDEFQDAFTKLLTTPPAKFFGEYLSFIQTFGTGCVSELYLTSGSAFEISANYGDVATTTKSKYGGSIAVGGIFGGAAVASEYAKTVQRASSNASMEIDAVQIPENTPTMNWCNSLMQSIASAGFEMLSTQPSLVQPYAGKGPDVPEIPSGKPSEKKLPENASPDIAKELQSKIMEDDKFRGTWEQYKQAQEEAFKNLKPEKVVKEVRQNMNQLLSNPQNYKLASANHVSKTCEMSVTASAWDLGGYIPYDYTVKPWEELFPQLKAIRIPATFSSIYIARAFIYYQTRMEFSSYLYFLKDVGKQLCRNPLVSQDADNYYKQCLILLENIKEQIKNSLSFQQLDCERIMAEFEMQIQAMNNFNSKIVYSKFFTHYDFFKENAVGFIRVADDGHSLRYVSNPDINNPYKTVPNPFSIIPMLKDGLRTYQIITMDGNLQSVVYSDMDQMWYPLVCIKGGFMGTKVKDANGFYYYPAYHSIEDVDNKIVDFENRMYGAGFEELEALNSEAICGIPMIHHFDFEAILNFANPKNSF